MRNEKRDRERMDVWVKSSPLPLKRRRSDPNSDRSEVLSLTHKLLLSVVTIIVEEGQGRVFADFPWFQVPFTSAQHILALNGGALRGAEETERLPDILLSKGRESSHRRLRQERGSSPSIGCGMRQSRVRRLPRHEAERVEEASG